jgi:hypothetical protein
MRFAILGVGANSISFISRRVSFYFFALKSWSKVTNSHHQELACLTRHVAIWPHANGIAGVNGRLRCFPQPVPCMSFHGCSPSMIERRIMAVSDVPPLAKSRRSASENHCAIQSPLLVTRKKGVFVPRGAAFGLLLSDSGEARHSSRLFSAGRVDQGRAPRPNLRPATCKRCNVACAELLH